MKQDSERRELFRRVQGWFNASEQVQHYQQGALAGPTKSESRLLETLPPGGHVLDLGCGAGRITIALARRGFAAVGVDVSANLLDIAEMLACRVDPTPEFQLVEGITLPFRDASFDAALSFKQYGYIPSRASRQEYLNEIARILKPGGYLLFTYYIVPPEWFNSYADELHMQAASQFTSLEPGDTFSAGQGYVHWFTPDALCEELTQSVFQLETFCRDTEFGEDHFMQLAIMRKPVV